MDGFRTLRGKRTYCESQHCSENDYFALTEKTPNLIPVVRAAGYRTCLLGKNHLVDWNLHRTWFDTTPSWNFQRMPKSSSESRWLRASFLGELPPDFPLERHQDAVTADETIDFIRSADKRPFFAMVDMSLPHPGYFTFTGMPAARLPLERIPAPAALPIDHVPFVERALRTSKDLEHLTDDHRRLILRAYWSMCEFADRQVEKILDAMDHTGQAENTLVIYTSDHGDFAADHNCYEKWDTSFLDGVVRVPFLLRWPGRIAAGLRSNALVELIDCFPTIADALGLDTTNCGAQGRSLWPLLDGSIRGAGPQDNPESWRQEVLCQGGVERGALALAAEAGEKGTDPIKQKVLLDFPASMARARMLRTERWKYIHRLEGGHELYDLHTDPGELHNLIAESSCKAIIHELRERLIGRLIETETTLPEIGKLYA